MTKVCNVLIRVYLLLVLVAVFFFSFLIPQNGWDLLGQLGSALSIGEPNAELVHAETYSIAKKTLDPIAYDELVNGKEERKVWAADHKSFSQLLPFYQPRVILSYAVYISYKFGLNPIVTMRFISSVCACIGMLFLMMLFRKKINILAVVLFPIIALLSGVLEIARFEGVDALSFCFFCASIYFVYHRHWFGLFLLAMLPATRSDMVMFNVLIAPYLWHYFKSQRTLVVISTLSAISLYLFCNSLYGNYGWMKQFYVVHVQYLHYPADVETLVTPMIYMKGVINGIIQLVYNKMFQFFLLTFSVVFVVVVASMKKSVSSILKLDRVILLALLSGVYVFVHFVVFSFDEC